MAVEWPPFDPRKVGRLHYVLATEKKGESCVARPNLDPIAQLKDGSQLFISTTDRGERLFACQVYQCSPIHGVCSAI